ncbi:isochorismate synthase MenF [Bacillus changyiensis]|uniref:isochorismate synthase n=1 Tax=Bacillus changyiensis TaxID=3004103 RepID=UPI003977ACAE
MIKVATLGLTLQNETSNVLDKLKKVDHAVLISYSSKIETIDPLAFFKSGVGKRFFWSDPDQEMTLVGLGQELAVVTHQKDRGRYQDIHEKWEHIKNRSFHFQEDGNVMQSAVGPLLFGGFSFDPLKKKEKHWHDYQEGAFFIPSKMLTKTTDATFITMNKWVRPYENVHHVLDQLISAVKKLTTFPIHDERAEHQQYDKKAELHVDEWLEAIRHATTDIQKGKYDKVVLAREILLSFREPIQLYRVISHLLCEQTSSYIFALEEKGKCFVGASPERLIKKVDDKVLSTCLAGSIQRGQTEREDQMLGLELLHDKKNVMEHEFVVDMIHQAFSRYCVYVEKPTAPELYKTKSVQHLYTPIIGQMSKKYSLFDFIEKLHPTPALGGDPQKTALEVIRSIEPMSRGWYAGPIGWLDSRDNGEFAVAIRSGLINSHQARLFAGCGIVRDSDPLQEYEETQIKLKPMLSALGGDPS